MLHATELLAKSLERIWDMKLGLMVTAPFAANRKG